MKKHILLLMSMFPENPARYSHTTSWWFFVGTSTARHTLLATSPWLVFTEPQRFEPGYRVYFGRDGDRIIMLLGGGTKKRQKKDIAVAKALWKEYKKRKRQET